MITLRVTNETKNSILATHAQVAKEPYVRKWGLIFTNPADFQPGCGLFFPDCNAVHTVQMSMPIDVIFIDMMTARVKKIVPQAPPGCHFNVLTPIPICSVLELPAGVILQTGTEPGDVIAIMSSGHSSGDELRDIQAMVGWPHR